MATGLSIHIGLNEVDERHYGSPCRLSGCVGDAHAMRTLAVEAGFEPTMLIGCDATADAVLRAIRAAAARIAGDGMLLVTYSGHGGRVRDVSGDEGGPAYWDETWCMHDRELVDDELCECWRDFVSGARILVVSDSCFSGDMIRLGNGAAPAPDRMKRQALWDARPVAESLQVEQALAADVVPDRLRVTRGGRPAMRALPARIARRVYNRHYQMYNQIQHEVHARPPRPVEAQVLLLSAAADNEAAADGTANGAFTAALVEVWNGGAFEGDYITLHAELFRRLAPGQHPQLLALRPPAFARHRPFTIDAPVAVGA